MSREDQHFRLRLPADLRALVERAAEANRRSLTAEILARLAASFETTASADGGAKDDQAEMIAKATAMHVIDAVLEALNAPEHVTDGERFRMLVNRGARRRGGEAS